MIKYALRCHRDHAFEGWFRGSAAFEAQAASGDLACPRCGSTEVSKAIMAPRIAKRGRAHEPGGDTGSTVAVAGAPAESDPAPAKLRAKLLELRRAVEASCENVGPAFAEEARKIHYGEAEARGIYGQTSGEEAKALADEGIPVARIPWVSRGDA